jgi:GNAT superfamily N-acetyltransferase
MKVSLVPPHAADDTPFAAQVTDLINRVYAGGEQGLWRSGAVRTTPQEVRDIVRAGELAVARAGGALLGSIRVRILPDGDAELGMLTADPAHRGVGVGRALVEFAEAWAVRRGAPAMRLERLVPREGTHPVKEFLREWYTRRGYRRIGVGAVEESYPGLAPELAVPCDFLIFRRPLRGPDPAGRPGAAASA